MARVLKSTCILKMLTCLMLLAMLPVEVAKVGWFDKKPMKPTSISMMILRRN